MENLVAATPVSPLRRFAARRVSILLKRLTGIEKALRRTETIRKRFQPTKVRAKNLRAIRLPRSAIGFTIVSVQGAWANADLNEALPAIAVPEGATLFSDSDCKTEQLW